MRKKTNLDEDFHVPCFGLRLFVLLPERGAGGVHRLQRGRVVEAGVSAHHHADDPRDRGGVHVRAACAGNQLPHVVAAGLRVGCEL